MPDLNHLFVSGFTDTRKFKSPRSVIPKQAQDKDRTQHGAGLLRQLRNLAVEAEHLRAIRIEEGFVADQGFPISLEIHPAGIIDAGKKLEWKRDGIEVLNVTSSGLSRLPMTRVLAVRVLLPPVRQVLQIPISVKPYSRS